MSKIVAVGATGFLGRGFLTAAKELGVNLQVLVRPESLENEEKRKLVEGFTTLEGDLTNYESLVNAFQGADVVLSLVGGAQIHQQFDLIKAAKEAGVKRVIPSEFGFELREGVVFYQNKIAVRQAIIDSGLEYTAIQANAFFETFGPGLANIGSPTPPESVVQLDSGDSQFYLNSTVDVAKYTLLAAQDPRAANQILVIAPPGNLTTQNQLIATWEELSGKTIKREPRTRQEFYDTQIAAYQDPSRFVEGIVNEIYVNVIDGYSLPTAGKGHLAHELYPQVQPVAPRAQYEALAKQ